MARQLIFKTNIDPAMLLPTIAPDKHGGRSPYYQVLPFFERDIASLCRSPDGTKVVITEHGAERCGGVIYELHSHNVFNSRTQDLEECPAYQTFAQLRRIARFDQNKLEFTLEELFFDFGRCSKSYLEQEKAAWAKALEEFKQGKLDRDVQDYIRYKERRR